MLIPNGVATTFQYDPLNRLTSLASNANAPRWRAMSTRWERQAIAPE